MEREGNVYDRLYMHSNNKLIMQAEEMMQNLGPDHIFERPNSCNKKGIKDFLLKERKDLTFHPKIHSKTVTKTSILKVEDRLLQDAYKRKSRRVNSI